MPPVAEITELNQNLADRINQEARSNPESPYAGKFVGIVNGQVVAVADSLREAVRLVRQAESDPDRACVIEASRDYSVVEEIWEIR